MTLLVLYQALGAVALAGAALLAPFVPALRRGLGERLGLSFPGGAPGSNGPRAGETIWVHAASVGEVGAAAPLIAALLSERPRTRIILSTFTAAGRRVAERTIARGELRVRCRFVPFDWGWIPRVAVRRERPSLFILLETELWPLLLIALRREGVPVLIANGRISPGRFGRYRALRGVLRPALEAVSLVLARTPDDAARFVALGVPGGRVSVAGNLKHARRPPGGETEGLRAARIRERLGVDGGRRALIAGSVRDHEAAMVLEAFRGLRETDPQLLLVLAPRHPERFDAALLSPWSGAWVRWSEAPDRIPAGAAVVLLDTLGELADCYAAAAVACVGGTWTDRGGHNLLEPAFHGVPVIFGPDFRHFHEEGRALVAAGGGFVVEGAGALRERCQALLGDPVARAAAGRSAAKVAQGFGGAVEQALEALRTLLPGGGGGRRG